MQYESQKISQLQPELCVALSQFRLIEMTGADAEKYLQGQLTCDVTKLAVGAQTLTCHCDPKGKMSSLFHLYRQSDTQFVAIIRQDLLPEALGQLKKYAVFSKITFTELDVPLFGTTSGAIFAKFSQPQTACIINENPEKGQVRYLFWQPESLPQLNAESALWDLMDIQDGVPILLKANQFEHIPQATNLQMIDNAISFSKGCYIGQETVARAKYRGANKRAMFAFVGQFAEGAQLPEIASAIELQIGENWKSTGTILAAIAHQNQLWLQVVLNKDIEREANFRVNNIPLSLCELPYTLGE